MKKLVYPILFALLGSLVGCEAAVGVSALAALAGASAGGGRGGSNACAGATAPVIARAYADLQQATTDQEIGFGVVASDGPAGSLTYKWDFGDGTTAEGSSVLKKYTRAGNYRITVKASNGCDLSAQAQLDVLVNWKLLTISWVRRLGITGFNSGIDRTAINAVAVDRVGNPVVAGETGCGSCHFTRPDLISSITTSGTSSEPDPPALGSEGLLSKFSLTGNRTWIRRLGVLTSNEIFHRGICARAISPSLIDDTIVTGGSILECNTTTRTPTRFDEFMLDVPSGFVARLNDSGQPVWSKVLKTEQVLAVTSASDGGVFVASWAPSPQSKPVATIRRLSTAGDELWKSVVLSSAFAEDLKIQAIALSPDKSNLYVVGKKTGSIAGQNSAGGTDIFAGKLDSQGNLIWAKLLGQSSDDDGRAIAVAGDGAIYVVGSCASTACVFKLASDGATAWNKTLDGNTANAVIIAADGSLYVGGDQTSFSLFDGSTKIFITRLFPDGSAAQTQLFGEGRESLRSLAQSSDKVIYASGVSGSANFAGVARVSSDLDGFLMKLQP